MLCNLYFGNAEREVFGSSNEIERLGLGSKSTIIRLMDDYIMISTDSNAVSHFLQRIHSCFKPYGGGVNPLKTRVNFDCNIEIGGERVALTKIKGNIMPWCGMNIDTLTLEVSSSTTRILGNHLCTSLSVDCKNPGKALRKVIKSFVRSKCFAITLDSKLNSEKSVFATIYRMFLISSLRTHAYLTIKDKSSVLKNSTYISSCVAEAVVFGARLIHSRTKLLPSKQGRSRTSLCDEDFDADIDFESPEPGSFYAIVLNMHINTSDSFYDYDDDNIGGNTLNTSPYSGLFGECAIGYRQAIWIGLDAFILAFNHRKAVYGNVIKDLLLKKKRLGRNIDLEMSSKREAATETIQQILTNAKWL
jgi:hypothetical protein